MEGRGLASVAVLECKPILVDFWHQWFSVYPTYGREIFDGNRVFLDSDKEFLEYLAWTKVTRSPAWLSVQPFNKRNDVTTVEKLFFDFDSKNLDLAWKEASSFAETLKKCYGVESLLCFSGSKGYHVYVWLQELSKFTTAEEAKRFCRTAQRLILKGLYCETLDPNPLGDIKRVARVPYSIHEKTLNPCVPVTINRKPCWILDLSGFRKYGLSAEFTQVCMKNAEEKQRKRVFHSGPQNRTQGVRPCLEAALNADLEAKEGHSIRIAIAAEYLKAGFSLEQTAELFKGQTDYSFERSLYYVQDILTRKYKPFKCATIRELGFCLKNCPRKARYEFG
jgi:hypothetical protein